MSHSHQRARPRTALLALTLGSGWGLRFPHPLSHVFPSVLAYIRLCFHLACNPLGPKACPEIQPCLLGPWYKALLLRTRFCFQYTHTQLIYIWNCKVAIHSTSKNTTHGIPTPVPDQAPQSHSKSGWGPRLTVSCGHWGLAWGHPPSDSSSQEICPGARLVSWTWVPPLIDFFFFPMSPPVRCQKPSTSYAGLYRLIRTSLSAR